MKKKLKEKKFTTWWNDGENKSKKFMYIFVSWWDNGENKFLKAIYFSIFLHILFGFFWLISLGIGYIF